LLWHEQAIGKVPQLAAFCHQQSKIAGVNNGTKKTILSIVVYIAELLVFHTRLPA
jgi:hypothetical protein